MLKKIIKIFKDKLRQESFYEELNNNFPTCYFEKGLIIKGPLKNLELGLNVRIQSNVLFHLGGMEWCDNSGNLSIGKNSIISPNTIIYAAGKGGVSIGDNFDCGPGVKIFSSSSKYDKQKHSFKKVVIGDNVILYSNVIISPGVIIGNNAVVLGGGVVNCDIPKNVIFGGVPAKFIKYK